MNLRHKIYISQTKPNQTKKKCRLFPFTFFRLEIMYNCGKFEQNINPNILQTRIYKGLLLKVVINFKRKLYSINVTRASKLFVFKFSIYLESEGRKTYMIDLSCIYTHFKDYLFLQTNP